MVWRCDIGERQNGNTNAPENLRNPLQNQVLSEPSDLGQFQIHPKGQAFWSAIQQVAEQKIGVAISADTQYLFLPSSHPAN
jgi:hypothetical protein